MGTLNRDSQIRMKTFDWLAEQVLIHGDVLPRRPLLEKGFNFEGDDVPLVSAQGIFKPRIMDLPLTITTSPKGPYSDSFEENGLLSYKYRGTDPLHRDNVGLRSLMKNQTPLVYFHGIVPNRYLAVWPAFIVGEKPNSLSFQVAIEDMGMLAQSAISEIAESDLARRTYLTTTVKQRLHNGTLEKKYCTHTEIVVQFVVLSIENSWTQPTLFLTTSQTDIQLYQTVYHSANFTIQPSIHLLSEYPLTIRLL